MASRVRIGIVGCGRAAAAHLGRLAAIDGVEVVGLADLNVEAARALAGSTPGGASMPIFPDHKELIRQAGPDAVGIFTHHLAHYRPTLDALQAGCHAFIGAPLTTSPQEAVDVAGLARARGRTVGIDRPYRLRPSLVEMRRRFAAGAIGPLRLVTATLSAAWLAGHRGPADDWRREPKAAGTGGVLADLGDHLIDALLWITGRPATSVAAFQPKSEFGLDLATVAAVQLADGVPATMAVTGVGSGPLFAIHLFGESGRLLATESELYQVDGDGPTVPVGLGPPSQGIEENFVAAVTSGAPLCCPADDALGTVRLLEAIARSAATGQVVPMA